ncbi:MAG: septal ring lytic transglycosylase RlpA family protein [Sulfurovum sp.]|nr:septal ring lytic transglycosylase RlpA family protein [Sulfurovum sp.]
MSNRPLFFLSAIALCSVSLLLTGCSGKKQNYGATKFTSAARHKSTMRCYTVRGKTYRPTYVKVGQTMTGISSWYGPNFHGKQTSNGERYNMHAKTAAHKTWPMDTMVKVTNLQNGRSTIVRINDRGPFVRGRIIDCSYAAGKELGLDRMGIAKVKIEVVGFAGKVQSPQQIAKAKATHTETRVKLTNFGIQVGAFSRYEGARITKQKYERVGEGKYRVIIKKVDNVDGTGRVLYRVFMMGFPSEQAARDYRDNCLGLQGALIIRN